jgi:hypothetical protein
MFAGYFALLAAAGCAATKPGSPSAPPAGSPVAAPIDAALQSTTTPPPTPAAPLTPAPQAPPSGQSITASPNTAPAASASVSAPPAAVTTPQSPAASSNSRPSKTKPSNDSAAAKANVAATTPKAATATKTTAAAPTSAAPAQPASPSTPTLNLAELEQRLRETRAIGVFTKLSLKNQVDDLLNEFRSLYQGPTKRPTPALRQHYDLLLLKVLSLLQDSDPPLAAAIASSREAIWGILADPDKFAKI